MGRWLPFAATATDLVDGSDPVIFKEGASVVHSGDSFALGSHTITASATDSCRQWSDRRASPSR